MAALPLLVLFPPSRLFFGQAANTLTNIVRYFVWYLGRCTCRQVESYCGQGLNTSRNVLPRGAAILRAGINLVVLSPSPSPSLHLLPGPSTLLGTTTTTGKLGFVRKNADGSAGRRLRHAQTQDGYDLAQPQHVGPGAARFM